MSDVPQNKPPFEETEAYISLLRQYWQQMDKYEKSTDKATNATFVRDRMEASIELGDDARKLTKTMRRQIEDMRQRYDRGEL